MKQFFFLLSILLFTVSSQAKSWRINNNAGVIADFTTFEDAVNSASVIPGDTIYIEPSNTDYYTASLMLSKRLVVLGVGYFLDPSNTNLPANTGLQVTTEKSGLPFFRVGDGANGSVFAGITFTNGVYINGVSTVLDILFERNFFNAGLNFENGNSSYLIVRKNFFNGTGLSSTAPATVSNFTCENNIFYSTYGSISMPGLTGSNNVIRNNTFYNAGYTTTLVNAYVANNIFGTSAAANFTNCTLKNNLFQTDQVLPGTATDNLVNVNMASVFVEGAGSIDSRVKLKAGSPALNAGLTIGTVTTPDCGAYGATDPYKLSGIPNIPTIYILTVPVSIPSGSNTMNITFSSRNNN